MTTLTAEIVCLHHAAAEIQGLGIAVVVFVPCSRPVVAEYVAVVQKRAGDFLLGFLIIPSCRRNEDAIAVGASESSSVCFVHLHPFHCAVSHQFRKLFLGGHLPSVTPISRCSIVFCYACNISCAGASHIPVVTIYVECVTIGCEQLFRLCLGPCIVIALLLFCVGTKVDRRP